MAATLATWMDINSWRGLGSGAGYSYLVAARPQARSLGFGPRRRSFGILAFPRCERPGVCFGFSDLLDRLQCLRSFRKGCGPRGPALIWLSHAFRVSCLRSCERRDDVARVGFAGMGSEFEHHDPGARHPVPGRRGKVVRPRIDSARPVGSLLLVAEVERELRLVPINRAPAVVDENVPVAPLVLVDAFVEVDDRSTTRTAQRVDESEGSLE